MSQSLFIASRSCLTAATLGLAALTSLGCGQDDTVCDRNPESCRMDGLQVNPSSVQLNANNMLAQPSVTLTKGTNWPELINQLGMCLFTQSSGVCKPETKCEKTVDPQSKYRNGGVTYRVDGNKLELDWPASLFMNLTSQTNYCLEMRINGEPLDNRDMPPTILRLDVTPRITPLMWSTPTNSPLHFMPDAILGSPSNLTMRGLWLGRGGKDLASTEVLLLQSYTNMISVAGAAIQRSTMVDPTTSWVKASAGPGSLFSAWRFGSDIQVNNPRAVLLAELPAKQYALNYGTLQNPDSLPEKRGEVMGESITAAAVAIHPGTPTVGVLTQTNQILKSYVSTAPNNLMEKTVIFPSGFGSLLRMTSYADKPDGTGTVGVLGLTDKGEPALFAWNGTQFSYDGRSETLSKPDQVGTAPTDALAVGDVDGNGYNDIILARGGKVKFFLQSSAGLFVANAAELTPPSGVTIGALAVGQLDGQGKLDLAIADATVRKCGSSDCNHVHIYLNQTP